MNDAAATLSTRVLRSEVVFSAGASALLAWLIPVLLLTDPAVRPPTAATMVLATVIAGAVAITFNSVRLRRYRFLLRALGLGSGSIEPFEMAELRGEPARITRGWLLPHIAAAAVLASPWRPDTLDWTTGVSLALLSAVIVAAAALPLHVLVRNAVLRAVELAPFEVMREVVEHAEQRGRVRRRIERRLFTAVATSVALVSLGSALIANAHLRRADEYSRETTARAVARSSLELAGGFVEGAGLESAVSRAEPLGFSAVLHARTGEYRVSRREDGMTALETPLDGGTAVVRFSGSTVPVLYVETLLVALIAVVLAGLLGYGLGRTYATDLSHATHALRLLGTEVVLSGRGLQVRPARFRVVASLQLAIEQLAGRFRVFAQAQERAIDAREAATRMRGLFFASVSHDLKSPLNAILGFAELLRLEPLTEGQSESLDVIERRGRELLALIETILDAARVEAGQLTLLIESATVSDLFSDAISKAKELAADRSIDVVGEVVEGVSKLNVDRLRAPRALATLIAYAMRQTQRSPVRIRASYGAEEQVRIDVEIVNRRLSVRHLERLLAPAAQPRGQEHRGLALGLSFVRSVIEQHGGSVQPRRLDEETTAFSVTLPAARGS